MDSIVPPGLESNGGATLKYYASGGDENPWLSYDRIKYYTNAFIVQDGKVLLGYKKRGFGQGKYNGFGGKVDPGETSLQAAIRELEEEAGVTAPLEHAGSLLFVSEGTEWAFQIEIYRAEIYEGTITESDEMRPEWFSILHTEELASHDKDQLPPIPFTKMWETDEVWLPLLFSKQKFAGRADFTQTGEVFRPYRWWYSSSTV